MPLPGHPRTARAALLVVLGFSAIGFVDVGAERSPDRATAFTQNSPPVSVGGGIREPRKIGHVDPIYPQAALDAGIQGIVIIESIVGVDGRVADATVLRGNPALHQAALNAVRQWQYEPTVIDGRPVALRMTVTVNFRIGSPGGLQNFGRAGAGSGPVITCDLTGEWRSDEGAVYQVRTVGNEIFWFGAGSGEVPPNVFHGELGAPCEYTGRWTHIRPGESNDAGTLTIRLVNERQFEIVNSSPVFPGRRWQRVPEMTEDKPPSYKTAASSTPF